MQWMTWKKKKIWLRNLSCLHESVVDPPFSLLTGEVEFVKWASRSFRDWVVIYKISQMSNITVSRFILSKHSMELQGCNEVKSKIEYNTLKDCWALDGDTIMSVRAKVDDDEGGQRTLKPFTANDKCSQKSKWCGWKCVTNWRCQDETIWWAWNELIWTVMVRFEM